MKRNYVKNFGVLLISSMLLLSSCVEADLYDDFYDEDPSVEKVLQRKKATKDVPAGYEYECSVGCAAYIMGGGSFTRGIGDVLDMIGKNKVPGYDIKDIARGRTRSGSEIATLMNSLYDTDVWRTTYQGQEYLARQIIRTHSFPMILILSGHVVVGTGINNRDTLKVNYYDAQAGYGDKMYISNVNGVVYVGED